MVTVVYCVRGSEKGKKLIQSKGNTIGLLKDTISVTILRKCFK